MRLLLLLSGDVEPNPGPAPFPRYGHAAPVSCARALTTALGIEDEPASLALRELVQLESRLGGSTSLAFRALVTQIGDGLGPVDTAALCPLLVGDTGGAPLCQTMQAHRQHWFPHISGDTSILSPPPLIPQTRGDGACFNRSTTLDLTGGERQGWAALRLRTALTLGRYSDAFARLTVSYVLPHGANAMRFMQESYPPATYMRRCSCTPTKAECTRRPWPRPWASPSSPCSQAWRCTSYL